MCGRYYIDADTDDETLLAYLYQAKERADRADLPLVCRGEIFPTSVVPVIATGAAQRTIGAYPIRWGFLHPTRGMQVINTRSETAAEKPLFCASIQDRRCAVPASGYYEWKKLENGRKAKYAFSSPDGAPLYLAGLYLRSAGMNTPCFSILTRDASDGVKSIHARMPVILPADKIQNWLSPQCDYAAALPEAITELNYQIA